MQGIALILEQLRLPRMCQLAATLRCRLLHRAICRLIQQQRPVPPATSALKAKTWQQPR
jgi:hypothetical protein